MNWNSYLCAIAQVKFSIIPISKQLQLLFILVFIGVRKIT